MIKEGWVTPINARKYHYFRDGYSLCCRWAYLGDTLDEDHAVDDSDDSCSLCVKKRKAERESEKKAE